MIKVLAIDDEPLALQQLASYIKKIPYFELCGTMASAAEARQALENDTIDAIFIDINMPDLNGLDFVRSLLAPPIVVFTTAYSEYALEGFKVNALHYLLKPFSMDEFRQAAEKVRRQVELIRGSHPAKAKAASADNEASENAPEATIDADAIYLKTDYKVVRVNMRDVRYVESMGSYLRFHLNDQTRPIMALLTMKKIEEHLSPNDFMRIHRSFIVNLHEIQEVSRNHVILDDNTSLPIGELYRDTFTSYINSHYLGR